MAKGWGLAAGNCKAAVSRPNKVRTPRHDWHTVAGLGSVDGPLDGIGVGAEVGHDEGGSDGEAVPVSGLETSQACRLAFGSENSPACRLTVFAASFSAFRCDTDAAIASIFCCISAASLSA